MDILNDTDYKRFCTLIYKESGISFSEANRPILDSRVAEQIKEKGGISVDEYYKLVTSNTEELKIMLDSVTTNLTRFFRNQPHFDALINYVFPNVIEQKKLAADRTIKIWSAGCSTGEEPYTIAMIAKRHLPPGFKCKITASDISLKSLMVGRQGFYTDAKMEGIPEDYLKDYFTKKEGGYQLNKDIMDMVKFDYHNLQNDSGARDLDVIFCRNVMIYFDEAAQLRVLERFWNSMAKLSYLFIGHSESLFGLNTKFEFLKTDWACIYRKNEQ